MGKLKDIDEAISEKRAHVMRLHRELRLLEEARALLNGGAPNRPAPKPVTKRTARRGGTKTRVHPVRRVLLPHPKRGAVSPTSDVGMAISAVREAGIPLHVDELIRRIEKSKGKAPNKLSLVGSLARLTKKGLHFYRSEPSTYGLLEWTQTRSLEGKEKRASNR